MMKVNRNSVGGMLMKEAELLKKLEISQTKQEIEIMATFLPDQILKMSITDILKVHTYVGVLLFADISGFSQLCQKYSKIGKGGIYHLTATLNGYIGALVEAINFYGGDILKFSGDAILACWKAKPDDHLYKIIHEVIVCALFIQKTLGKFETQVNVLLQIKLAISCGNMTFSVIGDDKNRHYVTVGRAVTTVNEAERISEPGDIIMCASAWGHLSQENYDVTYINNNYVKIWSCLYQPNERAKKDIYEQKENTIQQICNNHVLLLGNLYNLHTANNETNIHKLVEKFIKSLPERKYIKEASQKWLLNDLKPFIVKPVLEQIEAKQSLEYLTEMRHVTIQFINIIQNQISNSKLIILVDSAYHIVSSIIKDVAVINKITLFDKDIMILVIFGLRNSKHELESQKALKCGYKIRKSLSILDGVKGISVGITNGVVYCGVVGHPFRREYTCIGGCVNKAARIVCAYQHKVTCDHKTYENSKLSSCYFKLQKATELKGIDNVGYIFEYNEDFEEQIEYEKVTVPIIGRDIEMRLINIILNQPENADGYRGVCFYGKNKIGKSKLLRVALAKCIENDYIVASIELCGSTHRPYFCISSIYKQLYDAKTKLGSVFDVRNLPRTLWNINDILQHSTDTINRKRNILQMFLEIATGIKDNTITVVFIDNMQYIDIQSFEIILMALNHNTFIRLISAGQFDENNWDIQWKVSLNESIKLFEVQPVDSSYIAAIICQLLSIKGVSKKLITLIDKTCEGRPGWIQSCLLRLINNGSIEITFINTRTLNLNNYVFPDNKYLVIDIIKDPNLKTEEPTIVLVAELTDKINYTADLTLADIALDLFDSFSPYEQLVIKTGAVLGDMFTRSLITVILKYPNKQIFAATIKHLFEEDVFDCGTRYVNSGGFPVNKLLCACYFSHEESTKNGKNKADLPLYAFCKILHFKNKNLRLVAYDMLPSNQRRDLHLRTTDILENQNNQCPNCLRDNSVRIIRLRKFKEVIEGLNPEDDRVNEEKFYHEERKLKSIIRNNFKNEYFFDLHAAEFGNIMKRKLWDPSTCFCLEILTRVYNDLIFHSERAGNMAKRIFFLTQYGVILITMNEYDDAIPLLTEASELCMVNSKDDLLSDENFKKHNVGRIHMLLAECYFRLGNRDFAKSHITISLRQYGVPSLALKYKIPNYIMNRNFLSKMNDFFFLHKYQNKNDLFKVDFGASLNLLSNIFAANGHWDLAKLISQRSMYLIKASSANMPILCDIYSNAIDYYNYSGDTHICERLEKLISREILKTYTGDVVIELHALSKLIHIIFCIRVLDGRIDEGIRLGFRSMELNKSIQAYFIQNETLPILASILLYKKRIDEAVGIIKILYGVGYTIDETALVSYYAFCIELIIETNFILAEYAECESYAINYFYHLVIDEKLSDNQYKLIIYLYCYNLRKRKWNNALKWKKMLKQNPVNKHSNFISINNLLKLTECSLIMLIHTIELKKSYTFVEEQHVYQYLKHCKVASKKWKIFLPRYLHYMAYFKRIQHQRQNMMKYIKTAYEEAVNQSNILEQCWIKLNKNVWNGGFCFKNELKSIDWKLAYTYTNVQWSQILMPLPYC